MDCGVTCGSTFCSNMSVWAGNLRLHIHTNKAEHVRECILILSTQTSVAACHKLAHTAIARVSYLVWLMQAST